MKLSLYGMEDKPLVEGVMQLQYLGSIDGNYRVITLFSL